MNWNTLVKVVRYHLLGWILYLAGPWAVLAINFALYLAGAASAKPPPPGQFYGSGAVFAIYICLAVVGMVAMLRSLPFALSLGVSRRAYYAGTVLLGVGLAAVYGLVLAVLAVIERATTGWGVHLDFFQVSYILAGPQRHRRDRRPELAPAPVGRAGLPRAGSRRRVRAHPGPDPAACPAVEGGIGLHAQAWRAGHA